MCKKLPKVVDIISQKRRKRQIKGQILQAQQRTIILILGKRNMNQVWIEAKYPSCVGYYEMSLLVSYLKGQKVAERKVDLYIKKKQFIIPI